MSGTKHKFTCDRDRCTKTFTRKANLLDHISSVHDPTATKFRCAKCSNTFIRKSDRDRHERRQHGEHKYTCGQYPEDNGIGCGQTFARLDALKEHRRTRKCATGRQQNASNHLGQELYAIAASVPSSDTGSRDSTPARDDIEQTATTNEVEVTGQTLSPHKSTRPLTSTLYWDGWYQGTSTPPALEPYYSKAEQLIANLSFYLVSKITLMPRDSTSDKLRRNFFKDVYVALFKFQDFERPDMCKAIVGHTLAIISNVWQERFEPGDFRTEDQLITDARKHLVDVVGAHILTDGSCHCGSGHCVCDFMSWVEEADSAAERSSERGPALSADSVQDRLNATTEMSNAYKTSSATTFIGQSSSAPRSSEDRLDQREAFGQESGYVPKALWPGWTIAASECANYASDSHDDIGRLHDNLVCYIDQVVTGCSRLPKPTSSNSRRMDALLSVRGDLNAPSTTLNGTNRATSLCKAIDAVIATILLEGLAAINAWPEIAHEYLLMSLEFEARHVFSELVESLVRRILPMRSETLGCIYAISQILRPAQSTLLVVCPSWIKCVQQAQAQLTPTFLFKYWHATSYEPTLEVQRRLQNYREDPKPREWWSRGVLEMAMLTVDGQKRDDNSGRTENEEATSEALESTTEHDVFSKAPSSGDRIRRSDDDERNSPLDTMLYDHSVISNQDIDYEMRKKAGFKALDEFFGMAKARPRDPSTHLDSNVSSSDDFIPPTYEKELCESLTAPYDPSLLAARVADQASSSAIVKPPWNHSEGQFANRLHQASEEHLQAASQNTALDRDAINGLFMLANRSREAAGTNSSAWRAQSNDHTTSTITEKQQIKHQCCGIAFGSVHELVSHVQRMHGSELASSR